MSIIRQLPTGPISGLSDLPVPVQKGVVWLDEKYPDWAQRVDLERLFMGDCTTCMVGQMCGDYYKEFPYTAADREVHPNVEGILLGFNMNPTDYNVEVGWTALNGWWTEAVTARRNGII